MELSKDIAKIASEWWADKVYRLPSHNNGDLGETSVFAGMLADMLSKPIGLDTRDRFVEELTNSLVEYAKEYHGAYICLDCDYAPDQILSNAARKTGVDLANFPWKTSMHVCPSEVRVKDGYGAPWLTIYPAE
jgi:hypothetical protein